MDNKRGKNGRFKKGYSGGPGRSRKEPSKPLTYEDIELLLQSDLKDSDPKVRHTATRLLIALKNKMPDQDDGPILDQIFIPLFTLLWEYAGAHLAKIGQPISMIEAIDLIKNHMQTCPTSPLANPEFEEVNDLEAEEN